MSDGPSPLTVNFLSSTTKLCLLSVDQHSHWNLVQNLLLGPHAKQSEIGEPLVDGVPRQVSLLVALLRQESFLCNSIVGAMTVAKLIHEKDKVMQGGVAVAEDGLLQQ